MALASKRNGPNNEAAASPFESAAIALTILQSMSETSLFRSSMNADESLARW